MNQDEPLATVVVPVYNGERFVSDALESILDQDYERLEVVVVDDGSQDRTDVIARSFPAVRYVRQRNRGPASARNVGIALSRGELVTFLDADDVMLRRRVSTQVDALVRCPQLGCVLARQRLLIEPEAGIVDLPRDRMFGDAGGVQPQSAMVRRSVLERVGAFDPAYRCGEGIEWLARLRSARVDIGVLDVVLTVKRIHGANHDPASIRSALLRVLRDRVRAHDEGDVRCPA